MTTVTSRLPGRHIAAIALALLLTVVFLLPHPYLSTVSQHPWTGSIPVHSRSSMLTTEIAQQSISRLSSPQSRDRPLILFAYAETPNARENLEFFLKQGLHGSADFVFILNGDTTADELIRQLPNVRVVRRPNRCFDLGAFGEVLLADDLWKRYKRFITMNASIRGPFLPMYSRDCWSDLFLGRVTEKVKLAGLTMNCVPRPHVQSMLFATDSVGMSILLDPALAHSVRNKDNFGGLDDPTGLTICPDTFKKAIHAEVGMTELIKSQGYDVDVLLTSFHSVNSSASYCEEMGRPDDVLFEGQYFGTSVHPYETVFLKANRNVGISTMSVLTKWHLSRDWSSWDACKA